MSASRSQTEMLRRSGLPWRLSGGAFLPLVGVAVAMVAWAVGYRYTRYLPAPDVLAKEIAALLSEAETYRSIGISFRRLVVGLGLGYTVAVLVTLKMRSGQWWRSFFSPYVLLTLSTPSLVAALLGVVVFGFSEVGVYVAIAVVVFPFVVVSLDEGLAGADPKLLGMAQVYRLTSWQRLRNVLLPQISPELFAAFRNSHALAWKLVVVTEVFSQTTGIGYQYKRAYDFLDVNLLAAWVVFFLTVVFLIEYALLRPWERRLFRWRASS